MRKYLIEFDGIVGVFEGRTYKQAFKSAVSKNKSKLNGFVNTFRFRYCDGQGNATGCWNYVSVSHTLTIKPGPAPEGQRP